MSTVESGVRLTSLSHGGGCGCKLAPAVLEKIIAGTVGGLTPPDLLVGVETSDDAAVYRISDSQAIVATTDFFMPIVDDPFDFGAIAATNAISDVYAMGGTPLFGMAVVGEVHPDRMLTNAGACAGDVLVLTKPLGTGLLTTALKRGALIETGTLEAVRSMTTLNEGAARAALKVGVSAATDVTGFGLLGHLSNILDASEVAAEIYFDSLPILAHARNLASRGIVSGGSQRNLAAAMTRTEWDPALEEADRILCVDAQTSGGLLLAVPQENEARLLEALREEAPPAVAVIGRIVKGKTGQITVKRHA